MAVDTRGALLPAAESLDELAELARTAGATVVGRTTQALDHPVVATYIGSGKLEEVAEARRELHANVVIFDDELSPRSSETSKRHSAPR